MSDHDSGDMTDETKKPENTAKIKTSVGTPLDAKAERAARLAAALRSNLRRRKAPAMLQTKKPDPN